jgi:hypothetical protein
MAAFRPAAHGSSSPRQASWMAGAGVGSSPPSNDVIASTKKVKNVHVSPNRTICKSVVHIGDSTSLGLISPDYIPNPKRRSSGQYARVGATTQHFEISGGRSIYETFEGMPNAQTVAQGYIDQGFNGCWVLALGTNEAADVAAGSNIGYDNRIQRMMSTIGSQPVLWVNVRTLLTSGPYAEANMAAWDKALVKACNRYPHMRVYDWADDVKNPWFVPDGIHFTTQGYTKRARYIADALLEAFPDTGHIANTDSSDCVIKPEHEQSGKPGKAA